jgi:hypothetical protein
LERIRDNRKEHSDQVLLSISAAIQITNGYTLAKGFCYHIRAHPHPHPHRVLEIQPATKEATFNCANKLMQLRPIISTLDLPASGMTLSTCGIDLLNSPRDREGSSSSVATSAHDPRNSPYIIMKAIEREVAFSIPYNILIESLVTLTLRVPIPTDGK